MMTSVMKKSFSTKKLIVIVSATLSKLSYAKVGAVGFDVDGCCICAHSERGNLDTVFDVPTWKREHEDVVYVKGNLKAGIMPRFVCKPNAQEDLTRVKKEIEVTAHSHIVDNCKRKDLQNFLIRVVESEDKDGKRILELIVAEKRNGVKEILQMVADQGHLFFLTAGSERIKSPVTQWLMGDVDVPHGHEVQMFFGDNDNVVTRKKHGRKKLPVKDLKYIKDRLGCDNVCFLDDHMEFVTDDGESLPLEYGFPVPEFKPSLYHREDEETMDEIRSLLRRVFDDSDFSGVLNRNIKQDWIKEKRWEVTTTYLTPFLLKGGEGGIFKDPNDDKNEKKEILLNCITKTKTPRKILNLFRPDEESKWYPGYEREGKKNAQTRTIVSLVFNSKSLWVIEEADQRKWTFSTAGTEFAGIDLALGYMGAYCAGVTRGNEAESRRRLLVRLAGEF